MAVPAMFCGEDHRLDADATSKIPLKLAPFGA